MGDHNGQRDLLACVQPEDANLYRRPPERQRALNVCGHQVGGWGWGHTQQRALPERSQGGGRGTPRPRSALPPARIQELEEGGVPLPSSARYPRTARG